MREKKSKPAVRLVASAPVDPDAPPASLGDAGSDLWRSILSEFVIDDAASRQMLLQICHAADIAEQAHERGLLKDELQARSFITRGLHRLNFDVESPRDRPGRPAGTFNLGG
jgi:hypothetical protein